MKKLVKFFAGAALIGTIMTTQSCSKTCDAGYEGSDCKTEWSTKVSKSWSVTETPVAGGTAGTPYTVLIANSSANGKDISLSNLGNYTCSTGSSVVFKGTMTSSTAFAISDSTCGYRMTGTGTYDNSTKKITGTYTAVSVLGTESYNFVMQ